MFQPQHLSSDLLETVKLEEKKNEKERDNIKRDNKSMKERERKRENDVLKLRNLLLSNYNVIPSEVTSSQVFIWDSLFSNLLTRSKRREENEISVCECFRC